ncbi:MAG: DUF177 domain-containing protein [Bacillus sp. (in: Bacteria)]|nr:DUF177 domain-containing protein [Bacillus sp. (in: firmicutes)]MCM1428081.1 DUF177 domain-containing protein [Eubacterium sp.]
MFINLTDVLTSDDKELTMQVKAELTKVAVGRETFQILDMTPICFVFTNTGKNRAEVVGETEITFAMKCDRCLKPVKEKLKLHINRQVHAPDVERTESDKEDISDDDQVFMDGYQLNVEDLLNNEIIINWPRKVLCKPDCKGICLQCGKDLNAGSCECDTFVPDPRMAVIKDIFNANKEV